MRNIKELINFLETEFKIPVFYYDMKKDDIEENKSFFLYNDKGEIKKGQGLTLLRNFNLYYITRENKEIDEIKIINHLQRNHSLIFDNTSIDVGKIQNVDEITTMVTFNFHYVARRCDYTC